MDSFDMEIVYEYAKQIVDRRVEYGYFKNSEKLREDAAERLAGYLLSMSHLINKCDKEFLKRLTDDWINNDLLKLRTLKMQDRSGNNSFKSKKKSNFIRKKLVSLALIIVILGGAAFAAKAHSKSKESAISSSTSTVQMGTDMGEDIHRWHEWYDKTYGSDTSNEEYMEELLAEIKANTSDTPYCRPKPLTGDAMMNYPSLASNYSAYYQNMGPEYAQIALYDICHQIYGEYENDQYRTMDTLFNAFQDDLKQKTHVIVNKSATANAEYELVADYRTYPEYVYNMLKNAGYDVKEYQAVVEKYSSYDKTYPIQNNGLNPAEVVKMDGMFMLYDEYIQNLNHERTDHR